MKLFNIQFEMPCENPEDNVRLEGDLEGPTLLVPINHPKLPTMSLDDLLDIATKLSSSAQNPKP